MKNGTPECHWTSNNAYPFCFGAKYPHQFAENDCYTCPWYSEYWHEQKMKDMQEMQKLKELDMKNSFIEVEIYE